jgi:hypothetical protein
MSAADPVLVDVDASHAAPLSGKFHTDPAYRASADWKPRWAKVANPGRGATCQECAQLQHENRGKFGPRMQPRQRRSFPPKTMPDPETGLSVKVKGPTLLLCSRHAAVWEEIDKGDTA